MTSERGQLLPVARIPMRLFPSQPLTVLAIGVALAGGAAIAVQPLLALAAVGCVVAGAVLADARWRVGTLAIGGPLVFGSSAGLSTFKGMYLLLLMLSLAGAWISLTRAARQGAISATMLHRAELATVILTCTVSATGAVALLNDHSPNLWIRDAAPYFMIAVLPLLALDASAHVSPRFLRTMLVVAGLVTTASFTVDTLTRRGQELGVSRLALSSYLLPYAAFTLAFTQSVMAERRRVAWGALAATTFAALIITGTRASLLLLAVPIVVVVVLRGRQRSLPRAAAFVCACAAVVLAGGVVASNAGVRVDEARDRIVDLPRVLSSPEQDRSLFERRQVQAQAWAAFEGSPAFGVGPGRVFTWSPATGPIKRAFTVDTSATLLSKFGVLGLLGLFVGAGVAASMVRYSASESTVAARVQLLAFAVVAFLYLLLANPLEDKGFAIALLLLLSLALIPASGPDLRGQVVRTGSTNRGPASA